MPLELVDQQVASAKNTQSLTFPLRSARKLKAIAVKVEAVSGSFYAKVGLLFKNDSFNMTFKDGWIPTTNRNTSKTLTALPDLDISEYPIDILAYGVVVNKTTEEVICSLFVDYEQRELEEY